MLRITVGLIGLCLMATAAETYCDAPSEVQAELRRSAALWDSGLSGPKMMAARREILEQLVKRFPNDIQANRRYQNDSGIPKEELIAEYSKRLDAKPGDALLIYLYALVLANRDLPAGMRLFQESLDKDPSMAWPHIALAFYYASGPFADKKKVTQEVDAFFTKCPTSYDFYTNRMLNTYGSPALRRKVTAALRERVEAETDPEKFGIFEHLWALEFKVMPPAEHPGIRSRVASDLRRIRKELPSPSAAMLRLIRDGMRQAGSAAGAELAESEMLTRFPASNDAPRIAQERWRKEHPQPGVDASQQQYLDWARLHYAKSSEWVGQWPNDAMSKLERFLAALALKELPPSDLKAAVDGLLNFLKNNDAVYGFEPFEHQAADEYLKRKVYSDLVPTLAEAGLTTVEQRLAEQMKNAARESKETLKLMQTPVTSARIYAVELLARAKLQIKQTAESSDLESRLAAIQVSEPRERSAWLRAASYVAEIGGHAMDAYAYLEKSLELAPRPGNFTMKQAEAGQRERLRLLWAAAGGSERAWALRNERNKTLEAATLGLDWAAPDKPSPPWQLVDLGGRKWTSEQLVGKVVLANVWATWCGPCRDEHPHFQQLYEKLKDRSDVVLVSLNVDDKIGLVQSYMDQGKYTFPVLLAQDYMNSQTSSMRIPMNWLFDAKGVHRLTQEGFLGREGWEASMLKGLDKVLLK